MKKYKLRKYSPLWTVVEIGKIAILPFMIGAIWACMFIIGG